MNTLKKLGRIIVFLLILAMIFLHSTGMFAGANTPTLETLRLEMAGNDQEILLRKEAYKKEALQRDALLEQVALHEEKMQGFSEEAASFRASNKQIEEEIATLLSEKEEETF